MIRIPAVLFFAVTAFMMDCLHGMAQLNDAFFAHSDFHAEQWQQGLLAAVNAVGYAFGCLIFGLLSEKTGRRVFVLVAIAGVGITIFGLIFVSDLKTLYALSTLRRIFLSMFWPPLMAWVADRSTPKSLLFNLCVFNISWTLGASCGHWLVGHIGEWAAAVPADYHSTAAYWVSGVLAVVLIAFVFICIPTESGSRKLAGAELSPNSSSQLLKQAWLLVFLVYALTNIGVYMLPKLAMEKSLDLSQASQSNLHAARILFGLAIFILMLVNRHWQGRRYPIYAALSFAGSGILLMGLVSQFEAFLGASILLGSALGLAYTLSLFYSLTVPKRRGQGSGTHEAFIGLGGGIGPIVAGGVGSFTGSASAPFYVGFVFVILFALAATWSHRKGDNPIREL